MAWWHRDNAPRPVPPVPVDPLDQEIAERKAEIAMAKAAVARGHDVHVPPSKVWFFNIEKLEDAVALEEKYTEKGYSVHIMHKRGDIFVSDRFDVTVSWDDEQ